MPPKNASQCVNMDSEKVRIQPHNTTTLEDIVLTRAFLLENRIDTRP
jgi:hypothetical protein